MSEMLFRLLGHRLEPGGRVHRVADRRVLEPAVRADVAGHHGAAVQPDAHPEPFAETLRAEPGVELLEPRAEHLAGRRERSVSVIVLLKRSSEDGHDPVAEVGNQRSPVRRDRVAHRFQVTVENFDHSLGFDRLREAGEPPQVRKHHRGLELDAPESKVVVGPRKHVVDDSLRDEAREDVADALPVERSQDVVDALGADRPRDEADQGIDERDDRADSNAT